MTAAELVAAAQPCLPLPGIDSQGRIDDNDELGNSSRIVKGAIADACAERCWFIETFATGVCIWTGDDAHHANGTDAIAWCKAYAAALEGGAA